jgi:hypothetical protein
MVRQPVTVGLAAAAGAGVLALVDADSTSIPLCPLKALTGLDCPMCGALRAVSALTRLRVSEAFDHNLLFTAAVPLLVVGWVYWLVTSARGDGRRPLPAWATITAVVVLVAFAVVRNLPFFPWLASEA